MLNCFSLLTRRFEITPITRSYLVQAIIKQESPGLIWKKPIENNNTTAFDKQQGSNNILSVTSNKETTIACSYLGQDKINNKAMHHDHICDKPQENNNTKVLSGT